MRECLQLALTEVTLRLDEDLKITALRGKFREYLMESTVNFNTKLKEAASFGQPIIVFDPSSRGAIAYRELAKEVSGGAPQRVG